MPDGCTVAEMDILVIRDQALGPDFLEAVEQIILDDDRLGLRVLDDVPDLRADKPKIDRHHHEPSLGDRRIDFHPFKAVVREDGDPIALLEPKSDERIGEFAGTIVPVAEGQGPSEIARADLVRIEIGVHGDDIAEMKQPAHWSPVDSGSAPFSTSMAQRMASTTLRNSMIEPSPVRLTTRP